MKKLLLLGAGVNQVGAIRRMRAEGIHSIACDPHPQAPGKALADTALLADNFSPSAVLEALGSTAIDGVCCIGTDQALKTAALIAEEKNLPSFLSLRQAHELTNKKAMKEIFQREGLPHLPWQIMGRAEDPIHIPGPWVMKPLDSQGQRGIFLVHRKEEIATFFPQVLAHSREQEVLLESYLPCDEVTLTAWAHDGEMIPLSLSDRLRFPDELALGVCIGHDHPTRFLAFYDEICTLSQRITSLFGIQQGPLYYQFLMHGQEILINEVAARIGGAFEEYTIPLLCGVDLLGMNIAGALGETLPKPTPSPSGLFLHVALLFGEAGTLRHLETPKSRGLLRWQLPPVGTSIQTPRNASARVGYGILQGMSLRECQEEVQTFYEQIRLFSMEGKDLLYRPPFIR